MGAESGVCFRARSDPLARPFPTATFSSFLTLLIIPNFPRRSLQCHSSCFVHASKVKSEVMHAGRFAFSGAASAVPLTYFRWRTSSPSNNSLLAPTRRFVSTLQITSYPPEILTCNSRKSVDHVAHHHPLPSQNRNQHRSRPNPRRRP